MAKEHSKKGTSAKKGMALSEKKNMVGYLFIMPVLIGLVFLYFGTR